MDTPFRSLSTSTDVEFKGILPAPRLQASMGITNGGLYIFGGRSIRDENDDDAEEEVLDELIALEVECDDIVHVETVEKTHPWPSPRRGKSLTPIEIKRQSFTGGIFSELGAGVMLLYGGLSADETPLNEAWIFDTGEMKWTQMYAADASLLTCQCTFGAVKDGRLMAIDSSRKPYAEVCTAGMAVSLAGSSKLDVGLSLDPLQLKETFSFLPKMKDASIEILSRMENWIRKQRAGLDLSSDPAALEKNFDSLLIVMDALFTVEPIDIE